MFAFGKPNFRLSGQKLFLDFKNPFKITAFAEPERSEGEATTLKNSKIENWRRGWDSNPRGTLRRHGFPSHSIGPLWNPSLSLYFGNWEIIFTISGN